MKTELRLELINRLVENETQREPQVPQPQMEKLFSRYLYI